MERKQKQQIVNDLNKKMVFLTGQRQVGKTWLAKDIASDFPNSVYLNYDQSLMLSFEITQNYTIISS